MKMLNKERKNNGWMVELILLSRSQNLLRNTATKSTGLIRFTFSLKDIAFTY